MDSNFWHVIDQLCIITFSKNSVKNDSENGGIMESTFSIMQAIIDGDLIMSKPYRILNPWTNVYLLFFEPFNLIFMFYKITPMHLNYIKCFILIAKWWIIGK